MELGAAWNSKADFDFDLDENVYPVWDWPTLASAGFAVYLGQGYPLRLTADVQFISWEEAVGDPALGTRGFEDTVSVSAGAEYRFELKSGTWLFARGGMKSYDTPWGDEDKLPSLGLSQLSIDTKGDRINMLTLGLGLHWSRKTAEGKIRTSGMDVSAELFGETPILMAVGFTYQFD